MAEWCLAFNQSPATWHTLTRLERQAFDDAARAMSQK